MLPDGGDVQLIVEHALHQLFRVFFGPVESFLGVEVCVVEGVVLVADFRPGEGAPHE